MPNIDFFHSILKKTTLLNGLVSFYKLDGNSNDSSGNSNNGTGVSMTFSSGKINNAGTFNGSSSYITLPKMISNYMTLACWIKPTSMVQYGTLLSSMCANSSDFGGCRLLASSGTNRVCFNILPTATTQAESPEYTWTTGVWQHIVGTYDGASIKLYVNGSLHGQTTYSGTIRVPSNHYSYIGNGKSWSGSTDYLYNGQIDEAGIRNRALLATEVTELYNSGVGLSLP